MVNIFIDFDIERVLSEDKSKYLIPDSPLFSDSPVEISLYIKASYYYKEGTFNLKYEDSFQEEEEIQIISMIDDSGLEWFESDLSEKELDSLYNRIRNSNNF